MNVTITELVRNTVTVTDEGASVQIVGIQGPPGPSGSGVPGGTTGQALVKASNADNDTSWHTLSKTDVGLPNVDNTSDATKPISTATQTALAAKAPALVPTTVKASAYTAAANEFVPVDTTGGPVTLTLPTAPANGTRFAAKLVIQGGTNTVTITRGGTDVFNKTGGSTSVALTLANQGIQFQYFNGIWYGVAADLGLTALDGRYLLKTGDTMAGRIDFPSAPYDITNPAIRFTQADSSSVDDHAKGLLLEWGGNMSAGVNYPYGLATNAYAANPAATFQVPSTGYKKWGWIMTHYQSPASTGETVHQHLNLETVKADYQTVITRLQVSFGEDVALVSFPNSNVKVFNDLWFQLGTDAAGLYVKHDTALARIVFSGNTPWNITGTGGVRIGSVGAPGGRLHVERSDDGTIYYAKNTNASGNNTATHLIEAVTSGSTSVATKVTGESINRFSMNHSGKMEWGSGSVTRDAMLGRTAVAELTITGTLKLSAPTNTTTSVATIDAAQTLTNKSISGSSNTLSNIPESAVTNLTSDLSAKEPSISAGTSAQYYRGDKTMQTLNQDAVPSGTTNKAYTAAEQTKLAGIAIGATANGSDATLLNRTNHTGTQTASTISDFIPASVARARRSFYAYEDFVNNVNDDYFISTASGGSIGTLVVPDPSSIGISTLNTGSTTTGRAGQWSSATSVLYFDSSAVWTAETRVQLSALSTGTDTYQFLCGFLDSATAEAVDGAYFSYSSGLNSGKFELVTASNSVRTRVDSGITTAASTWYVLKVVVASISGTLTARFYINDVQVGGDVTTTIPSSAARATGYGAHIIKSAGTTNVFASLDYMEVSGYFGSSR